MSDTALTREPEITEALVAAHGLKPDEYQRILDLLGRKPTLTELGIFSAMWNEHCSYKSSKKWLRTLPTTGPQVICGPGENAGVVDIGDGQALVFKMESHNHPSYIEPYQGAATGVGGILRDVFTMGARPIAAMNALSLRRADASEDAAPGARRGRRHRRLRQRLRRADGRRRAALPRAPTTATAWSTPSPPASPRADAIFYSAASGVGHAGRLSRRQDRARRRRRRDDGLGRVRRHDRGEAPDRAGRRPLHREAADGGLPRADGDRARSSRSRTWARPASPARRSRWATRATSASGSTSTACRCARPA